MFVLSDTDTGYGDESMRFASLEEAEAFSALPENEGRFFRIRIED